MTKSPPGWLAHLLDASVETHSASQSARTIARLQHDYPDDDPDDRVAHLVLQRFSGLGLRPSLTLPPHVALTHPTPLSNDALALLWLQWDALHDVAQLHGDRSSPTARQLQLLAAMAAAWRHTDLTQRALQAHRRVYHRPVHLSSLTPPAEATLLSHYASPQEAASCQSLRLGLTVLDALLLGRLASHLYLDGDLDPRRIDELHLQSHAEKAQLFEVLLAVAWADGTIAPQERSFFTRQLERARLSKLASQRLLGMLETPPKPDQLQLQPVDDGARRFILEQGILLSLVDDDQDPRELDTLAHIAQALGGSPDELEACMVEVAAFFTARKDTLFAEGPPPAALSRIQRLVYDRATQIVQDNARAIGQELRETGELARLLGTSSLRSLTPAEHALVRAQLMDLVKSVPALGIFLLPGGGVLLPILVKVLPFDLRPTAFQTPTQPPTEPPSAQPADP